MIGVEELAAVPAPLLGPVHGGVGVAQEALGRAAGAASATAMPTLAPRKTSWPSVSDRLPQHLGDALGEACTPGPVGVLVLADDHELVAAEAGHRVVAADDAPEPFGHRDEERVADGVAPAVVDELEPVEVDEQHGHRRRGPGTAAAAPGRAGRPAAPGWGARSGCRGGSGG